jgi:ABC-2 type transport system ATP-binding protein
MIRLERLTRVFGDHVVIRDLGLEVQHGERVALRGPNGSGKTTVLRCVIGTLAPSSGKVTIDGHDAGEVAARALTGASLSQERSFYLRLTGRQNLLLFGRLRGLSRRGAERRLGELAEELELGALLDERGDRCSTGMLQQLSFARALFGDPAAIILDEPTRSLDIVARDPLWGALDPRQQAAVLIATHVDDDVRRVTKVVELGDTS